MASTSGKGPWLFGVAPDLLIGCGLGYACIFLMFSIGGAPLRLAQPEFVIPLFSVLLSGPHYGATLLRVYERSEDRRAYAFVSLWATLIVGGLFTLSIYNGFVATWFFTAYVTWSPYHYTRQNYGVSMMFLGRGGVSVTPLARRLLNTSFMTSFFITFLVIHTFSETSYNPNPIDYNSPLVGQSLGIPLGLSQVVLAVVSVVYIASTVGCFGLLARGSGFRALAPAAAVVVTQALWFSLPFSVLFWGIKTGIDPLDAGLPVQYVFWTAIGHALQYQFVTTYFARSAEGWRGYPSYLGKCLAAGAAIWTVPAIVFAPDLLGQREFTAGLGALVAAGVNLHHFILDGAIWKLRSKRVADVLIRSNPQARAAASGPSRRSLRRVLWISCGAFVLIRTSMVGLEYFDFPGALREGNHVRAERTLDVLAWFGRDSSSRRNQLAAALSRQGDPAGAEAQSLRSLELGPSISAWTRLADVRAERKDWPGVLDAYQESRALGSSSGIGRLAKLAMRGYYKTGQRELARGVLEEFARSRPQVGEFAMLAGVAREAKDIPIAILCYREVLRMDPARHSAANNLAWILATTEDAAYHDPAEAILLAERAVDSTEPPDPNYLDTLATAYAAAGDFRRALATAGRALSLAEDQGDAVAARAAGESLERYRSEAGSKAEAEN